MQKRIRRKKDPEAEKAEGTGQPLKSEKPRGEGAEAYKAQEEPRGRGSRGYKPAVEVRKTQRQRKPRVQASR